MKIFLFLNNESNKLKPIILDFAKKNKINIDIVTSSNDFDNTFFQKMSMYLIKNNADKLIIINNNPIKTFLFFSKIKGLVSAICPNNKITSITIKHNNSNVLCLDANSAFLRFKILSIIKIILTTKFEGGRHIERINTLKHLENKKFKCQNEKNGVIVIGCDHAGYIIKNRIIKYLSQRRFSVLDVGCFDAESTNYAKWGLEISKHLPWCYKAIAICGSGIGICNAINKSSDEYACPVYTKKQFKELKNNNVKILGIGANFTKLSTIENFLYYFLK